MVSWHSVKECKVVQDGGLVQCNKVKGVGSMRYSEDAKMEQSKMMR